jgi:hypothetical protein
MNIADRNVIYFPYIRVPDSEWFNRVLLYWDQVSSIIPGEYVIDPGQLGGYMDRLIRTKLVKPINPTDYINKIPHFTDSFLAYVDSPDYPVLFDPDLRRNLPATRIHADKMAGFSGLIHGLTSRNLAKRSINYPWYDVEVYTANQYMAYLSACLGNLPDINALPVTDTLKNSNAINPASPREAQLLADFDIMRTVILEKTLPCPSTSVPPEEIARFKQTHKRELTQFRNKIENLLIDSAAMESPLRNMKVDQFIIETNADIEYLTGQMKNNGWRSITLGNLLAFGKASFKTTLGWFTTGLTGAVGGAMEFPAAINDGIANYRGDNSLKGHYAAYAVLANQNLIDARAQNPGAGSFLPRIFRR